MIQQHLADIVTHFHFEGSLTHVKELTAGNVNMTYQVVYAMGEETHAYVLQRINTNAFHHPDQLMDNVGKVTAHMRHSYAAEGVDPDRRVLTFVESDNGTLLYTHTDGSAWRAYHYIDGVTAYNSIENPAQFYEAGRGFGEFQTRLSDFPACELVETIPGFHNTANRYGHLLSAIQDDAAGRVASLGEEIAFFHEHKDLAHAIVSVLGSEELPLRVTHNDTKLNNVLMDNQTGKALCVIDLDTVMPGSSLYDFGDAVRYGACTSAEDEPDTAKVGFDMALFEAFTKGFVEATAGKLTNTEILMLPTGVAVITYELAMRFLTDYINGDVYFKTSYEGHNLVRARAQMALLKVVLAHMDEMNAYVAGLLNN